MIVVPWSHDGAASDPARNLLNESMTMTPTATLQERWVLNHIPSARSGNAVAIVDLAAALRASEPTVRLMLARLHAKNFIITDGSPSGAQSSLCMRTEAGDAIVEKRLRPYRTRGRSLRRPER